MGDYGSYQEHVRSCANVPLSDFAVLKDSSDGEAHCYNSGSDIAHVEEQKENLPIEDECESTVAPGTTSDHDCYVEMHEDSSASNVASTISIENPSLTTFHADPMEPEAKRDSLEFKIANDDTSSTGLSDD